jgi:hypothetical protein
VGVVTGACVVVLCAGLVAGLLVARRMRAARRKQHLQPRRKKGIHIRLD